MFETFEGSVMANKFSSQSAEAHGTPWHALSICTTRLDSRIYRGLSLITRHESSRYLNIKRVRAASTLVFARTGALCSEGKSQPTPHPRYPSDRNIVTPDLHIFAQATLTSPAHKATFPIVVNNRTEPAFSVKKTPDCSALPSACQYTTQYLPSFYMSRSSFL